MKVIIPVAGIGTRMRPHTHTAPKALLHVAGKPILGHILDGLKSHPISEVIFVVGFLGEKIVEYVQKHYKFKSKFMEQKQLKGLGYAIYLATLGIRRNEPLLIILGDTIIEYDFSPILKGKYDAIGIKMVEDPRRFGVVELKNGFVYRLVEKPKKPISNLAIIGIYYIKNTLKLKRSLNQVIARKRSVQDEYQLTDALQLMVNAKVKFTTFNVEGWYDCGKPESILETNRHLLSKMKKTKKVKGSVIIPPTFISRSAVVEDSILGPYVSVADHAVIKNSIIRNSIISEAAEVNNSLLDSSLVGNNAEVNGNFHRFNVGDSSELGYYYSGFEGYRQSDLR
jgi:glucose-1-phosphate thymidylyltransferase